MLFYARSAAVKVEKKKGAVRGAKRSDKEVVVLLGLVLSREVVLQG